MILTKYVILQNDFTAQNMPEDVC